MLRALLLGWLVVLTGCRGEAAPATGGASTTHAAADPSAMCAEHGVLEAVCTKCNPKLAPVFQAKGDWCAEHGFPESFCPICHPERGGRPQGSPALEKAEMAPPEGTKVKIKSKEIVARVGIETVDAAVSLTAPSIDVLARIALDARRLAHVNARSAGVVRAIAVDVGERVKRGQVLATIDSREVGADRSRANGAAARVAVAKENLERQRRLFEEGVASRTAVAEAEREVAEASADLAALRASLSVVGKSAGGAGGYALEAPFDGVVTVRGATVGELVEANELIVEVVDPSAVWAELDVPEMDLGGVVPGRRVAVTLDALPGRELQGTVSSVAPAVDPTTRTAKARVPLANADGALHANMFGRARVLRGAERPAVLVPRAAVQRAGGVPLVFVKLADDLFVVRRVTLGAAGSERSIEIEDGLSPGEPVVTTGSFLLKTETLKGSIGAGCCEVD